MIQCVHYTLHYQLENIAIREMTVRSSILLGYQRQTLRYIIIQYAKKNWFCYNNDDSLSAEFLSKKIDILSYSHVTDFFDWLKNLFLSYLFFWFVSRDHQHCRFLNNAILAVGGKWHLCCSMDVWGRSLLITEDSRVP